MSLTLPALSWPLVTSGALLMVGLGLVLVARLMRKRQEGGSPAELRLFFAGSVICLLAALIGWFAL